MTEPHTADLATRFRYRKEGAVVERERILALITEELINCECENPWQHAQAAIKEETK